MKNTFTVNDKEYEAKPFGYNMICDFDDMGVSIAQLGTKQSKAIRTYFALCSGLSATEAGNEIEKHIINGGDLGSIAEAFSKELENSDFFQALQKNTAEKKATGKKAESKETE